MRLARQGQDVAITIEQASVCFRTLMDLLEPSEKPANERGQSFVGSMGNTSKAQHLCNYAVFLAYVQVRCMCDVCTGM